MALPKIKPYTYVDREHSNRVSWPVDPSRAVLLVHDMQVHFVQAFEGANLGEGNDNPDAQINIAIRNLRRLIDAAHTAGIPVYYTAQPPRQNPAACSSTSGATACRTMSPPACSTNSHPPTATPC